MMERPIVSRLRRWAGGIRTDVVALCLATRDPRVPWYAKVVAGSVAAYALSPIDLIPDFIPVLGHVDDIVIVPLGILLAIRLIPPDLMDEHRRTARAGQSIRPTSRAGAIVVVAIWLLAAAGLADRLVFRIVL